MRRLSLAALALGCGLAWAAPGRAAGMPPKTSEMLGTDRACNAGRPDSAKPADVVRIARLRDGTGTLGPWLRTNPALDDAARAAASFAGGEFATIVAPGGAVAYASLDRADGKTGASEIDVWCYFGGQLIRTTIETFDPTTEQDWRRTRYYANGDTTESAVDVVSEKRPPGGHGQPLAKAPLDRLVVPAASKPADLPFASAYAAAKAKALPILPPR